MIMMWYSLILSVLFIPLKNVRKSALFVHCFSHKLNLCFAATCKSHEALTKL